MGEGRTGKATHRQNNNVIMPKAGANKICDDRGDALDLLPGLLVCSDADAKPRQWIGRNEVEGKDT